MIMLALPVGSMHGWGICGKYIAREMAALNPGAVRLLTQQFTPDAIGDELEFHFLNSLLVNPEDAKTFSTHNGQTRLPAPLLTCIADKTMVSWAPQLRGTRTVGYTFFEDNLLQPAWIENARKNFDSIAAGSSWCADVLKGYGLSDVHTVIQGVDPRLFFPGPIGDPATSAREFLRDRFVIFSGGKFEFRKGQDIVIRAVKVLQDRHRDVFLINSWFNAWQQSFDTMRVSPHLRWPSAGPVTGQYPEIMARLLAENGLDLTRVITLSPRPNALMPCIYRNTDIGLFPNRCEGGTNLVLMEYMACGKPVVATAATGHRDIVRPENGLPIRIKNEFILNGSDGQPSARWPEPDLDDTIEKLEWAYQHRQQSAALGHQAGIDLARMTWTQSARTFQKLLA